MNNVEMTLVTSSTVESVGYDAQNQELHVNFLKGGLYIYSGVPESVYNELVAAVSPGTYLDQNVKKAGYSYRKG
jgi:hypothetical protein